VLPHIICYLPDGRRGRLTTRRLSIATRRELIEAVGERYRRSDRSGKAQILTEFLKLTGYHRKHAIRVLCYETRAPKAKPGPPRRYTDEERAALIALWEAADQICGKRLKAVIPDADRIDDQVWSSLAIGRLTLEARRHQCGDH
jgi:hypothetical protein